MDNGDGRTRKPLLIFCQPSAKQTVYLGALVRSIEFLQYFLVESFKKLKIFPASNDGFLFRSFRAQGGRGTSCVRDLRADGCWNLKKSIIFELLFIHNGNNTHGFFALTSKLKRC